MNQDSDSVRAATGKVSWFGPEVPPDTTTGPRAVDEPTVALPVVPRAAPVAARAVIVYEPEPRRRWGLPVFTAVMVALTLGVVLGQTATFQPVSRSASAAQTEPLPSYEAVPAPPPPPLPITAPRGVATERLLEVTGNAAVLRIHSADLGPMLFSAAGLDSTSTPDVVDTAAGPRIGLGGAGVEIQLNSAVRWTVRLAGSTAEQYLDLRAGGLAGIELTGGAARAVMELPRPAARTVPLRIAGAVQNLEIRSADAAVRLRLSKGAGTATVDGKADREVRAGAVLSTTGWRSAGHRYDVKVSARVDTVLVDHAP